VTNASAEDGEDAARMMAARAALDAMRGMISLNIDFSFETIAVL
jgi:predicted ABC-type ATPase